MAETPKFYVQGFILAVPEGNKEKYREIAASFAEITRDYGMIEVVENWEEDVPNGEYTDFRKAVNIQEGEKVVFSWVVWPDKATADASHEKMMADPRMQQFGDDMPFDGRRMVYGGFSPIFSIGRG